MGVDVSSVIDSLERQGAELDFLRSTTFEIQQAATPERAIQRMIERVCRFKQWPAGHAYMASREGHLTHAPLWYLDDGERFAAFRRRIEELPNSDGIGLADRVLDYGEPQWIRGLCESRQKSVAQAAVEAGITTAFAFPVSVNMTIEAVIEFFSAVPDAPEQSFLEIMSTLCLQLGRTLERRQTAQLEAANRRLLLANARLQHALAAGGADDVPAETREQGRFLTNMGHEFRTPLTTILGFSELLLAEAAASGERSRLEDLERIHDAASHLLELVDGIIELSRVQAQEVELTVDSCDVKTLVTDLCASLHKRFVEKANVIDVDCGHDTGTLRTDCQKVRRCLNQLLENANKFTEDGRVELVVSRLHAIDGDRILFRVKDTGIGMTPEQLGRLFQPFSQADTSAARRYGGIGLGLALAQNLANLLGGQIRVESALGEGTVCSLEVPAELPFPGEGTELEPFPTTTTRG